MTRDKATPKRTATQRHHPRVQPPDGGTRHTFAYMRVSARDRLVAPITTMITPRNPKAPRVCGWVGSTSSRVARELSGRPNPSEMRSAMLGELEGSSAATAMMSGNTLVNA